MSNHVFYDLSPERSRPLQLSGSARQILSRFYPLNRKPMLQGYVQMPEKMFYCSEEVFVLLFILTRPNRNRGTALARRNRLAVGVVIAERRTPVDELLHLRRHVAPIRGRCDDNNVCRVYFAHYATHVVVLNALPRLVARFATRAEPDFRITQSYYLGFNTAVFQFRDDRVQYGSRISVRSRTAENTYRFQRFFPPLTPSATA